ncbi:LOW QUALITY PROTEIN: ATPase family gene 2 protein homolog A-like [Macrobrachium rosenbergii]|uniref:LOW QUALITY PROTEIN: ATPase family gene 2 protein homolog A-like n=1 Tax=Macrobrachium rosenbergii TaxID=79674 RepID=UPI0034D5DE5A
MADAYIPCLKCKALIPQYVREVHATECHVLKLRSFSHPRIAGSSLIAQALIIGGQGSVVKESGTKNRANKQNETHEKNTSKMQKGNKEEKKEKSPTSGIEEPDWLKKIWSGFHYRMAVINEVDLIRCNLTAFTPVLLEHSGNSNAFIVVPDNGIRVGHVMLHNIGVMQYFSSVSSNTLITIRKLDNVKFAKEIQLSPKQPLSKEECIAMEIHMKTLMFSSFPLGAPFTIRKNCLVYPNSSEEFDSQVFTVKGCILQEQCFNVDSETDQLLEDMSALHIQSSEEVIDVESSVSEPSLFADRNDEDHDGSSLSQAAYITIDEYKEGDSLDEVKVDDECFVTSTPNRKFSKDTTNICKTLLSSKSSANVTCLEPVSKDVASKRPKESAENFWLRVGRDTKIAVERSFKSDSPVPQQTLKRDTYCKDNLYFMLKKFVENKLKNSETDNPFLSGWNGVLLYGPPGTGKTLLVGEIAHDMNVPVVALSLADVVGSSSGGSESVRQKFRLAVERAPSFLFIDEIDSLCPVGDHRISGDKDLTRAVINAFQLLKTADNPVFLIAATSRIEGVSQKLRCSGRFDKEILVPLPTAQQRSQILHKLISSHRHDVLPEDITSIARQAYGFSGADLNLLLKCAWFRCVQKNKKNEDEEVDFVLSKEDLQAGMAGVSPTVLRQNYQAISLTVMQLHIAEPENYPLRGVLLYGPPGCSKTMFVKALVTETSFSFFPVKCSDLLSKYVGETEKSLVKVFERARQACPSIIFMDEVDSLCGDRAGGSGLVSELLSLMSESALPGNILVIGATNRPHALDEALLKPGCLEQVIHIDLPDYDCRCAVWSGMLKDVPCSGEVDIAKLSQATEGYSGAEIRGVYQHAAQSIISCLALRKEQEKVGDTHCVTMSENCILESIAALPPRTPVTLLEKIKGFSVSRNSLSTR